MPLGGHVFTGLATGLVLVCLGSPAGALEVTCQADKYEGQRQSSANTLFITEFHISDVSPVDLCPQRGGYFKREPHLSVTLRLPIHFWFRLEGDRSLIDALTAQSISSLRIKPIFERKISGSNYESLERAAGEAIKLKDTVSLPEMRGEATANERAGNAVTDAGHGLFDWRGNFIKRSDLSERGGFRVKLAVDRQDDIRIVCGRSLGCQVDGSGPAWIAFIR